MAEEKTGRTFAREYRPNSLSTYVGNQKVVETVRNTIARGNRPKVILIDGITGSGKTTIARILMKEYECTGREPGHDACGVCPSCQAFDEYIRTGNTDNLPDVKEINVAQNSGKGDIVDILEDRTYLPVDGLYKYYYFDEVHKASDGLQNYLLKPLEEPEEHVVYILATTDVDKLLPTIRNRANLVLKVKKATELDIAKLLGSICKKEEIPFEDEAFRMIATRADYIIRESLNYLQQVVDAHGACTAEIVSKEFELVTDSMLFDFYRAYIQRDYMGYMTVMHHIKTTMTFESFLQTLRTFTIRGIYVLNGINLEGMHKEEIRKFSELFSKFDVVQLSLLLSRLLSLGNGNIEANLLNFMYRQNLEDAIAETYSVSEELQVSPKETKSSVSPKDEQRERNKNLEVRREDAELRGQQLLAKETEGVQLLDMLSGFPVQSVKGTL